MVQTTENHSEHIAPELMKELEAAQRLVGHPVRLSIGGPTKTVKEAYFGDYTDFVLSPENSRNLAVFLEFTDNSFCLYSDFLYHRLINQL